jgi:hypothetical protein
MLPISARGERLAVFKAFAIANVGDLPEASVHDFVMPKVPIMRRAPESRKE